MKVLLVINLLVASILAKPRHGELNGASSEGVVKDLPWPLPTVHDTNPEALNPDYTDDGIPLYEDDMILSQDQVDFLYGPLNTRKAIDDLKKRWTNGNIPFIISESSIQDRQVILQGLQHWMNNTCLKFVEVKDATDKPHLTFKKLKGCRSQIGMQEKGQDVLIGSGCESMGTVAHEVGHALGFYHEQSRPDRDQYVKIFEANMEDDKKEQFQIVNNINDYGVPYDLGSLMHYGLNFCSKNGKRTMVPLDVHRMFDIGHGKALSFLDIKLANLMYNCSVNCGDQPSCENGGFVDHTCKCRCPKEYSGLLCQTKVNLPEPICGGYFSRPTNVTSPNYPNFYPQYTGCVWSFQAPEGKQVRADFTVFAVGGKDPGVKECWWGWMEIQVEHLEEGKQYCGDELMGKSITSSGNEMAILFKSVNDQNRGFVAKISFV